MTQSALADAVCSSLIRSSSSFEVVEGQYKIELRYGKTSAGSIRFHYNAENKHIFVYVVNVSSDRKNHEGNISLRDAGAEALKSTLAYKIRKAFGFSKIIKHKMQEPGRLSIGDPGFLEMIVERDDL